MGETSTTTHKNMSDKIKFKVFHNRVVVLADKPAEKSDGGVMLSDTAKKPVNTGTVVDVGPMCGIAHAGILAKMIHNKEAQDEANKLVDFLRPEEGDRVWFLKHAGTPITIEGVEYMVFDEREIVGKLL